MKQLFADSRSPSVFERECIFIVHPCFILLVKLHIKTVYYFVNKSDF